MKKQRTIILNLTALLISALNAVAQSGGPYSLNWHTIDGGGGKCAGGAFAIHGTIGQPESGEELRSDLPTLAGNFESNGSEALAETVYALRGGFWPGAIRDETGPRLTIQYDDLRFMTLNWPFPSTGFVLQQTTNLNAPGGGWTNFQGSPVVVGPNWQVGRRATNAVQMFRLRKP